MRDGDLSSMSVSVYVCSHQVPQVRWLLKLAQVQTGSPGPLFCGIGPGIITVPRRGGGMVDAVVSNTTWATSGGSSPPPGTTFSL